MTDSYENADGSRTGLPAGGHRFTIDPERDPSLSIVEELATYLECDPTDLEPLYHDVDPDVLDRLVTEANVLEFRFASNDVCVTVYGDGRVVFEPEPE